MKNNKSVVQILKEFELTDDQILKIATEDRLLSAARELQAILFNKWIISTLDAVKVVKSLKEELN